MIFGDVGERVTNSARANLGGKAPQRGPSDSQLSLSRGCLAKTCVSLQISIRYSRERALQSNACHKGLTPYNYNVWILKKQSLDSLITMHGLFVFPSDRKSHRQDRKMMGIPWRYDDKKCRRSQVLTQRVPKVPASWATLRCQDVWYRKSQK